MFRPLSLLTVILSVPVSASTVIYTDRQHPPANITAQTRVVYLDEAERYRAAMFGALSSDPAEAARQARAAMRAPGWPQKEAALAQAFRDLVAARELGVEKYPAVVFDNRDVVWGTADIAVAQSYRTGRGPAGGQP